MKNHSIALRLSFAIFTMSLLFIGESTHAQSARTPITELKSAMMMAVKTGNVQGVFSGELGEFYMREFQSAQPVLLDITRIGSHQEAGCARLTVHISQGAVRSKDAAGAMSKPKDQSLGFNINYCADGRYPAGEEK